MAQEEEEEEKTEEERKAGAGGVFEQIDGPLGNLLIYAESKQMRASSLALALALALSAFSLAVFSLLLPIPLPHTPSSVHIIFGISHMCLVLFAFLVFL